MSDGMYPGAHAAATPDKPAYVMASTGEVVTYAALDAAANRLSQLFHVLVDCRAERTTDVAFDKLLGQKVSLRLEPAGGTCASHRARHVHGFGRNRRSCGRRRSAGTEL